MLSLILTMDKFNNEGVKEIMNFISYPVNITEVF